MPEKNLLLIKCVSSECQKQIKMRQPENAGIYKISCPHCKLQMRVNIPEGRTFPTDNSQKEIISVKGVFYIDTKYEILCPHCQSCTLAYTPKERGLKGFACPKCKGKIAVEAWDKTKVIAVSETINHTKGKLQLLRKGWFNKEFPLSVGKNIIGRFDEEVPTDIAINDDLGMSRRSIEIDVLQTPKGYSFKLKVLKSTNPVLHNNKPLLEGEAVSLNFGDGIILGKTQLRFVKDK